MASSQQQTRRGVIGTIATLLGGSALAGTASSEPSSGSGSTDAQPDGTTPATSRQQPTGQQSRQYEWYSGTVDRIVDGEHVVILLEAGGRVVEQVVVDRSELQNVDEGDSVLVLLADDEVASIVRLG